MKIYISGLPKSGKTTLVENILSCLGGSVRGFYTKEVLEDGRRRGFVIITTEGREKIFASKDIQDINEPFIMSPMPMVGKYYINTNIFDDMLKNTFNQINKKHTYLVDEIGSMELLSDKFRETINSLIAKDVKLVATVGKIDRTLYEKIFNEGNNKIFHLNPSNREEIRKKIEEIIKGW